MCYNHLYYLDLLLNFENLIHEAITENPTASINLINYK